MNIVKEYIIFEKFTDDSDPIEDMSIGVKQIIKKFKKELAKEFHYVDEYDFEYDPKENLIKIDCSPYSKAGLNLLDISIMKVIKNYENIFKIEYIPTYDFHTRKISGRYLLIKVF